MTQLIPFHLGNDAFCVDMRWLRGIERTERLQRNPGERPHGWLLGQDVPVFDTARELFPERLGEPGPTSRILDFDIDGQRVALLVDRVSRAFHADLQPMPTVARDPFQRIQGVAIHDDRIHLVLAPLAIETPEPVGNPEPEPSPSGSPNLDDELTAPAAHQNGQLVTFSNRRSQADATRFALSLRQIAEILPPAPITRVPATPPWLLGLIDWRGRPVPVIDPSRRLGGGITATERLLVVWTGHGNHTIALTSPSDVRMLNLPIDAKPLDPDIDLPIDLSLTRGAFQLDGAPLIVPDVERLLGRDDVPTPVTS